MTEFTPVDDIANARRKKKNRQAFYTPLPLVNSMVELASNRHGCRALEPSAGDGRIVHALIEAGCPVDAYEMDEEMSSRCAEIGANMLGGDFLRSDPAGEYDLIVMNPPFQRGQAEKHIEHAYRHLSPYGILISVAPWNFRDLLRDCKLSLPRCTSATYEELAPDAFKESGAGVKTVLLFIDGPGDSSEVCGFSNNATANAALTIESDQVMADLAAVDFTEDGLRGIASQAIVDSGASCYGVNWTELSDHFRSTTQEPPSESPAAESAWTEPAPKKPAQRSLFNEDE